MASEFEELERAAVADPKVIALGGGLPDPALFPRQRLTRAFVEAVQSPAGEALQYAWPEGLQGLRVQVADRLRARGADVAPDEVLITNGAQQAIAIATQLLCPAGSRVGVDPETYPAALALFRARGVIAVSSAHEAGGKLAALYRMPAMSNPHGRALDGPSRSRLLAARTPIIEDDAYAEVRFDGLPVPPPLLAEDRRRVFHVGTLSKTLCPGLRVGWLVPPKRHFARALRIKHGADLQSNSLSQSIVESFLRHDDFDARLVRLCRHYARKAARLLAALGRHVPELRVEAPQGGFAIWATCDRQIDELQFLRTAVHEEGVSFDPGSTFRPDGASRPFALRLCFSILPEAQLEEGARRLGRAFGRTVGRKPRVRSGPSPRATR